MTSYELAIGILMGKNKELPIDDTMLQIFGIDGDTSFIGDPEFHLQSINDTMRIEGHRAIDRLVLTWAKGLRIEGASIPDVKEINRYGDQKLHVIFKLENNDYLTIVVEMNTTYNKLCIKLYQTSKIEEEFKIYGDDRNVSKWDHISSQSSSFRITSNKIRTTLKKEFQLKLLK
jgi:hypothetical protein